MSSTREISKDVLLPLRASDGNLIHHLSVFRIRLASEAQKLAEGGTSSEQGNSSTPTSS